MKRPEIIVGLEIGTSKVCASVGEILGGAPTRILGVGQVPVRGVRKGEIVDVATASQCIRDAIADAEEKSDVTIKSVVLGISGGHLQGFNTHGEVEIKEDGEVDEADCQNVENQAREVMIPAQNTLLNVIHQEYEINGQRGVLNPIGMRSEKLRGNFHLIHGIANRMMTGVRCVKAMGLEVDEVVFNGLASALAVLTPQDKNAVPS